MGKSRNKKLTMVRASNSDLVEHELITNVINSQDEQDGITVKQTQITFRTPNQKIFWDMMGNKEISIGVGSAGTGKTYLACAKALELMLYTHKDIYKQIILTTPAQTADNEQIGFLPGTLDEKMMPHVYSMVYIFEKILGKVKAERFMHAEKIKILPLAYMRGINIDNAILICDEAQNMTKKQMKTMLTRIGENSKFIITGDLEQQDKKFGKSEENGLLFVMENLTDIQQIGLFEFQPDDVVRNKVIPLILNKFN